VAEIGIASVEGTRQVDDPDEEVALAARTDPRAFEPLYLRHRLRVFRFLRARTGSDDDAAELTAIVFERALRAIGQYRTNGGGVVAWLFTIARNAAADTGRATRSHGSVRQSTVETDDEPREPDQPELMVVERERLAALRDRVERLPAAQRDAIVLRYAGGLTAREIGATLGKSEAATQKILSRGLAALRETYRDDA